MTVRITGNFRVGNFEVNRDLNTIALGDKVQSVEPKVVDVLHYLACHKDQVVNREQLMSELWPAKVSDGAVSRVIALLRKALGDNADMPRYIQTIPKKGYRLIAEVESLARQPIEGIVAQNAGLQEATGRFSNTGAQNTAPRDVANKGMLWRINRWLVLLLLLALGIAVLWQLPWQQEFKALYIGTPKFIQVTSEVGFEYDATLSQDEKWLLYRHRPTVDAPYNLYLKVLDSGQRIRLTESMFNDRSPSFSPDARQIAFFRKGSGQCHLMLLSLDALGNTIDEKQLYQCGAVEHYSNVVWAPDAKSLYFTDRRNPQQPYQIHRLDLATDRLTTITAQSDNYYGDNELAMSPSGRYLAFLRNKYWGNNEVYIKDLQSGQERKLVELGFLAWNISWTADEQFLLYSDNRTGGELKLINVETGELSSLYHAAMPMQAPELSSSGNAIVYAIQSAEVDLWQQALSPKAAAVKLDASSSRIDSQPCYSPDGQSLLFLSDRNGLMQLWLNHRGELTVLDALPQDVQIDSYAWHPDGNRIAVATSDKKLYLLNAQQNRLEPLPLDDMTAAYPQFSRDGTTLYFTSDNSGDWQLWAKDLASQQTTQLTQGGGYQMRQAESGALYFTKFHQTGIWYLDLETKKEHLHLADVLRSDNFAVCNDALYYLKRDLEQNRGISLMRHSFLQGTESELLSLAGDAKLKFDLTPECDGLVYSKWRDQQSDIMLMRINQGGM
ncbi:winged helix-turn-helix domain-containing protein [Shewanella sedimentimangrovi]|uniref:PD40 domain-containing protein n=1 Tax=Shewanella sedimentimangrovi TaxID=2814293 RepID=A0ABX7QWA4_9GAMM|nr:winged helix-turn-helix domain-containing protein [Shewanella sedimentimangrovi]QSX35774.1 PD40 domain-containing protein [Shewanella sedimentimangrovi]